MTYSKKLKAARKTLWSKYISPYIKLRDCIMTTRSSDFAKCIACEQIVPYDEGDAGHFCPAGNCSTLEYNEENIHFECRKCNCSDGNHLINYEKNLVDKIGRRRVNKLQDQHASHKIKLWTLSEIQALKMFYKGKMRRLKQLIS